jgi:hypothetical protein
LFGRFDSARLRTSATSLSAIEASALLPTAFVAWTAGPDFVLLGLNLVAPPDGMDLIPANPRPARLILDEDANAKPDSVGIKPNKMLNQIDASLILIDDGFIILNAAANVELQKWTLGRTSLKIS